METLSYGFKKPETGDKGPTVFPALEDNWEQVNDHDHDGVDSAKLTTRSSNVVTQSVPSGSWVATSGGTYRQLVNLASVGLTYDTIKIDMRLSTGEPVIPTIEKVSATTYYVYTNDNTVSFTAVYSS
jgi:hypothetical protein